MVTLQTPKRVTLLNGTTFVAKYKRRKKSDPPGNVAIRRRYEKQLENVNRVVAEFKRAREK